MNELEIVNRLERIESALALLLDQRAVQEWYDTATVAAILGKSAFTVRQWCNEGRVHAEKRRCGRGYSKEWKISHEELLRIKAEGLLPKNGANL